MTIRLSDLEERVFLKWLDRNGLIGQVAPSHTSNTRTRPTLALLVPADFVVAEYNQTNSGGHITARQLDTLLKQRGIEPYTSVKDRATTTP